MSSMSRPLSSAVAAWATTPERRSSSSGRGSRRSGQALRHLGGASGGRQGAREVEQRGRLFLAALGVGQGSRPVEHGGGKARVDVEDLLLLREEAAVGLVDRDQAPVVAMRGADVGD